MKIRGIKHLRGGKRDFIRQEKRRMRFAMEPLAHVISGLPLWNTLRAFSLIQYLVFGVALRLHRAVVCITFSDNIPNLQQTAYLFGTLISWCHHFRALKYPVTIDGVLGVQGKRKKRNAPPEGVHSNIIIKIDYLAVKRLRALF